MADLEFDSIDESIGPAPESSPLSHDAAVGEIAMARSGDGRRVPYMDSKAEMQRFIQEDIRARKMAKHGFKKHEFIVTDDLAKFLNESGGKLEVTKYFGINSLGAYVPYDKDVIDFYSSVIIWSNPDTIIYKILKKVLNRGYCLVYHLETVRTLTDYEPIFNTQKKVIAMITDEGDILANNVRYRWHEEYGYKAEAESFSVDWYTLVKLDDMEPIYADAVNLINTYTDSLNDNNSALKSFAESILTITGIDSTQGITPEQLQAIGEEAINVLAFEAQMSGDGTFANTPTAGFIAPPLNTEAREKWSERIRKAIHFTLALPDFDEVSSNVSTDTTLMRFYRTSQKARNIANDVINELQIILGIDDLAYEIDIPQAPNDNMQALNDVTFLSDETKIRLSFPEWDDARVNTELSRLQSQNIGESDPAAMITSFVGGADGD